MDRDSEVTMQEEIEAQIKDLVKMLSGYGFKNNESIARIVVVDCKYRRQPAKVLSLLKINRLLLDNAHGCRDVNNHHGVGAIEKGCTMCWAEAIHAAQLGHYQGAENES